MSLIKKIKQWWYKNVELRPYPNLYVVTISNLVAGEDSDDPSETHEVDSVHSSREAAEARQQHMQAINDEENHDDCEGEYRVIYEGWRTYASGTEAREAWEFGDLVPATSVDIEVFMLDYHTAFDKLVVNRSNNVEVS